MEWIRLLERFALPPDLVVFLRIHAEEADKRRQTKDRNEENIAYQRKVAEAYEKVIRKDWLVIDATRSKEEIHGIVLSKIISVP